MPNPPLDREEYIEQAYFFRVYRERLDQNMPAQEILESALEEILSTTKLPYALEFLKGEMLLHGHIAEGMARLSHYFTPFQAFVMSRAEEDRSQFDHRMALLVLEREAEYRAQPAPPQGLFIYQFECISRNKLGFDRGFSAMAEDPAYTPEWAEWILRSRLLLGTIEFADLIYLRSDQAVIDEQRKRHDPDFQPEQKPLFGAKEGRIAKANRGKDPLYMFAALQRQLGYPAVPRPVRAADDYLSPAALEARMKLLEKRLQIIDTEMKGELDLRQFYAKGDSTGSPVAEDELDFPSRE
ncbi:MAG: hypothetical protein U0903_01585 [Planctomycetales bacterium]